MAAVTIKKESGSARVVVKGFGFVTRSEAMPVDEAIRMAAEIELSRAFKKAAQR